MPSNSRWDLIHRYRVKIVKNPGNERLNNLNYLVLNVLIMQNIPKYKLSYNLEAHCKHDKLNYEIFIRVRVKMGISKTYI